VDPCSCWPLRVPGSEYVARAVYYDFHLRKNRTLKWQAFEPDKGDDDLSVMRTNYLSSTECKQRAQHMNASHKVYEGFALLLTATVRKKDFSVRDSRRIYCGHADIFLHLGPIPLIPDGEPPDPTYRARQKDAGNALIEISILRLDTDFNSNQWPSTVPWLPEVSTE
jgi:hypothetical protein